MSLLFIYFLVLCNVTYQVNESCLDIFTGNHNKDVHLKKTVRRKWAESAFGVFPQSDLSVSCCSSFTEIKTGKHPKVAQTNICTSYESDYQERKEKQALTQSKSAPSYLNLTLSSSWWELKDLYDMCRPTAFACSFQVCNM